jgi:hypothetical protein
LVTTSGARAHPEFTTDRAVLRQAVARLTARELRPEQLWPPRLSEYQIHPFDPGDYELRLTVTDQHANQTASRLVDLRID